MLCLPATAAALQGIHQLAQHPTGHCQRQCPERRTLQAPAIGLPSGKLCKERSRLLIQIIAVRRCQRRQAAQGIPHRRIVVPRQLRQQLQAQSIACTLRQIIRGIMPRCQLPLPAIGTNSHLRREEQRTNDSTRPRPHTAETIQTAAAQQMRKHGLGLIIRMMGRGNDRLRPQLSALTPQKGVTQGTGCCFQRLPMYLSPGGYIRSLLHKGQSTLLAKIRYKQRILSGGFPTDSVLKMGYQEPEAPFRLQSPQQIQQCQRIRTAGTGNHYGSPPFQQLLLPTKTHKFF